MMAWLLFVSINSLSLLLLIGLVNCTDYPVPKYDCDYDPPTAKQQENKTETEYRRHFILNMTRVAWSAYSQLQYPSAFEYGPHGAPGGEFTLAQSLSTLWLMNLTVQFGEAKRLLEARHNLADMIQDDENVDVSRVTAEYIGSMLSCFALTGDEWFRTVAQEAANALKPAFKTEGLPYAELNLDDPTNGNYYPNTLAQLGGQHLEYRYMADLTNDTELDAAVTKIRSILRTIDKPRGLYMTELDNVPPNWRTLQSSLFRDSNTFYTYLIKAYIQSNFTDGESISMFNQAIDAVDAVKMIVLSNRTSSLFIRTHWPKCHSKKPRQSKLKMYRVNGKCRPLNDLLDTPLNQTENALTIVRDYEIDPYLPNWHGNKMWEEACNLGAMFGLSVWATDRSVKNATEEDAARLEKYLNWAVQLTETCHLVANMTLTGLVPRNFIVRPNGTITYDRNARLSPHLAESYFVLYRLTKDPKYRQYAWELVQSINTHARTQTGLFNRDVHVDRDYRAHPADSEAAVQASDFIGATLKYLYLTFTDETVLSLDAWIFNRAGQPLPIWNRNKMYSRRISLNGGLSKSETTTLKSVSSS